MTATHEFPMTSKVKDTKSGSGVIGSRSLGAPRGEAAGHR